VRARHETGELLRVVAGQGAQGWQADGLPDPSITSSGLSNHYHILASRALRHAGTRAPGVSSAGFVLRAVRYK
jgi:hypothetical protein